MGKFTADIVSGIVRPPARRGRRRSEPGRIASLMFAYTRRRVGGACAGTFRRSFTRSDLRAAMIERPDAGFTGELPFAERPRRTQRLKQIRKIRDADAGSLVVAGMGVVVPIVAVDDISQRRMLASVGDARVSTRAPWKSGRLAAAFRSINPGKNHAPIRRWLRFPPISPLGRHRLANTR